MRVLHLPITALYQPNLMVKGLRTMGVEADQMLFTDTFKSYEFDDRHKIITGSPEISSANFHFIAHALEYYDVFHLHSGYGFFYESIRGKQLALLHKAGKPVVMSRWGCRDGRTPTSFEKERGLCGICPVHYSFCSDSINRNRLKTEERYVDLIINHEPDFTSFNSSSVYLPGLIDMDFWHPDLEIPKEHRYQNRPNNQVLILHAVGGSRRGDVKGTSILKATVEKLQKGGVNVVTKTISGISFKELRYHILQADIIVDQLRYGAFGSFAREAMALGKPVVGTLAPSLQAHLADIPLLTIERTPLKFMLMELIRSPEVRLELGAKNRAYAETHFCHRKNAEKLNTHYEKLQQGKKNAA